MVSCFGGDLRVGFAKEKGRVPVRELPERGACGKRYFPVEGIFVMTGIFQRRISQWEMN